MKLIQHIILWLTLSALGATTSAQAAANDIQISQRNPQNTAWVDRIFAPASGGSFNTAAGFLSALGGAASINVAQKVATVAALKATSVASLTTGTLYQVQNYASANDGGGGFFYYDADSAASDNGGTTIAPNAGTGRWLRLFYGDVSVRWFGAKGDNVADDTVAITRAITVASISSGVCYLPKGQYRITSALSLPSNTWLKGDGIGVTYLNQATLLTGTLIIDGASNVKITSLSMFGQSASVIKVSCTGDDVYYLNIRDVEITELGANAIGLDMSSTVAFFVAFPSVQNLIITGGNPGDWQSKIGMKIGGDTGTHVVGMTIVGGRVWRTNKGIYFRNCDGVRVYNTALDDVNGNGIEFATQSDKNHVYARFEAGTFGKYVDFGTSADNYVDGIPGNATTLQVTDSGVRNGWNGSDGSLGLGNKIPNPQTFTSQVTSTVATGTAPLVVASTTNVANLNASSLNGATFAAPGPIGSTTPSTGAFATSITGSAANAFTFTMRETTDYSGTQMGANGIVIGQINMSALNSTYGTSIITEFDPLDASFARRTRLRVQTSSPSGRANIMTLGSDLSVFFDGVLRAGSGNTTLTDSTGKILSAALNTVAVGQGGTGLTSGTSGGILGYTATGTLASSALLAANGFVLGGGAGATPTATQLTGVVQGNGSSAPTAITNSSTVGQVLRVTGTNTYAWGAVDLADTDAVTGALPVINGGTGQTTYTNGQLLIGNTTGGTLTKATLTAGTGVTITNGTGSITIAADPSYAITTVSANTTLTTANYTTLVNAAAGAITITLPAAASNTGRVYNIKKIDATGNVVTVDANAAETIDGSLTQTLDAQWESVQIQSSGSAWFIL